MTLTFCFGLLAPEQDCDPREGTDDPTESQTLPSRHQPARRREKRPQALHDSRLLRCPVRQRLDTATALEVRVEKQPIRVRIPSFLWYRPRFYGLYKQIVCQKAGYAQNFFRIALKD